MDYNKEIESLVSLVLKEGASDLHLSEGRNPIIRVTGTLIPLVKKPVLSAADMKGFVGQFLSEANKKILEVARNADFSYSLPDARFRGNVYYHQGMLSVALRLIPKVIKTLAELNLPPILETFTRKQQGFFLVVGPIGQGKTTTLGRHDRAHQPDPRGAHHDHRGPDRISSLNQRNPSSTSAKCASTRRISTTP